MTTTLLIISMKLTFLDFTCEWDYAVFVFLYLAYLLQIMSSGTYQVALVMKNPPAIQETQKVSVQSLGREDPLKEEMATHSSILVWEIPRTEGPGGLQLMGSQ